MSTTTDEIIEKLKSITLLEASELVTQLEQTFGVDVSASMGGGFSGVPGEGGGANVEVAEEKTSFNVILQEVPGDKRVAVLKKHMLFTHHPCPACKWPMKMETQFEI